MWNTPDTLPLPGIFSRRLDTLSQSMMHVPQMPFDFSAPRGEAALIPARSVSWRIFKNPIALFIGGVTAVLMEMAHPKVRDGVWQHSGFRSDPLTRLRRTGLAAMVTVYGPRTRAEAMIGGVVRMHEKVSGETTEGQPYRANDQDLLDWVQATAGFGFMEAYHAFVRPLSERERDAVFAEALPAARLYGAVGAPGSQQELSYLFKTVGPKLVLSPIVGEFLDIMSKVKALPAIGQPLQKPLLKASVSLLPPWLRTRLELGSEWTPSALDRLLVKTAAGSIERIVLPSSPAVQSCRRLGLADDYLYRRQTAGQ